MTAVNLYSNNLKLLKKISRRLIIIGSIAISISISTAYAGIIAVIILSCFAKDATDVYCKRSILTDVKVAKFQQQITL
ncbi:MULTISPECIES: hypothetical protein [unclassified Wolbachia]|uniref:hypothetical protein n=1 Tax=unclassified Wolbachia TaxID=2640676 RepID=UPI0022305CCD|nr:hypothetical protein [Wolbachia endosymbiont (group A) of Bibio marci]